MRKILPLYFDYRAGRLQTEPNMHFLLWDQCVPAGQA